MGKREGPGGEIYTSIPPGSANDHTTVAARGPEAVRMKEVVGPTLILPEPLGRGRTHRKQTKRDIKGVRGSGLARIIVPKLLA